MSQFDGNVAKLVVELEARIDGLEADLKQARDSVQSTANDMTREAGATESAFGRMGSNVASSIGTAAASFLSLGGVVATATVALGKIRDALAGVADAARTMSQETRIASRQLGLFDALQQGARENLFDRRRSILADQQQRLDELQKESRDREAFQGVVSSVSRDPIFQAISGLVDGRSQTPENVRENAQGILAALTAIPGSAFVFGEQADRGGESVFNSAFGDKDLAQQIETTRARIEELTAALRQQVSQPNNIVNSGGR